MTNNYGTDARAREAAPRAVEPEVAEELAAIDRAQWNVIEDPETGEERQARKDDVLHGIPSELARQVRPLVPSTLPHAQAYRTLAKLRRALAEATEGNRVVAETPSKRAALADELARLRAEREAERGKVEGWQPSDGDPPSHVPLMRLDRLIRENRAQDARLTADERTWTGGLSGGEGKLSRAEYALPELVAQALSVNFWDGTERGYQRRYASWLAYSTQNAHDVGRCRAEDRRREEQRQQEARQIEAYEAAKEATRSLARRLVAAETAA